MSTSKPTLIVNARLVNEGREFDSDLRIEDGLIAQIGTGLAAREGEHVVDAAGRRVLPGMIDDQVHFREPGLEYKADIATESAAAVAGGLTSFMDMPNTSPPPWTPRRWRTSTAAQPAGCAATMASTWAPAPPTWKRYSGSTR